MRFVFLFILATLVHQSFGTQMDYAFDKIPDELKENANAIIRLDDTTFEIISEGKTKLTNRRAITILNSEGDEYAEFVQHYSEGLTEIRDIKGRVFNMKGEEIDQLRRSDIKDVGGQDESISDVRYKIASMVKNSYPYTVEYEFTKIDNMTLFYPNWSPVESYYLSLQKGKFSIVVPNNNDFYYKLFNIQEPVVEYSESRSVYNWELSNISALRRENYSVPWIEKVPTIFTRPNNFVVENYQGSQKNWEEFGMWMWDLNKGLDQLTLETISKVKALTNQLNTVEEKVEAVYKFVQDNTRYVSVQLGIGGWRPIAANKVDEKGYGDCKGLSNYTIALLKIIGVAANYVVIKSGSNANPLIRDFASSQFDHVIVCVPLEKDTIWLECTSQTNPFGYLGTFTGDRDALAITEGGGKIVHTVGYPQELNTLKSVATVSIAANGNATARTQRTFSGLLYEYNGINSNFTKGEKEQKDWINNNLDIPNFEILNFSLQNKSEQNPSATEETELLLERYASITGKRLFFKPNLLTRKPIMRQQASERRSDIYMRYAYVENDTIIFNIPENFHPEFLPEDVSIESEFGSYTVSIKYNAGKLIYARTAKINRGRFSKEKYKEWIDFNTSITNHDNLEVVLVNKT